MFSGGAVPIELEYDPDKGEVYLGSLSCELNRRNHLVKIRKGFMEIIGGSIRSILYRTGKKTGLILADHFDDLTAISKLGYGVPDIQGGKVRVRNSFTSMNYRSEEPVCEFLEGILAGWFTSKESENIDYRETKCRALGDEYCEFERKEARLELEPMRADWERGEDLRTFEIGWNRSKGEIIYKKGSSLIFPRGFVPSFQRQFEEIIGPVSRRIIYNQEKKLGYAAVKEFLGRKGLIIRLLRSFMARPAVEKVLNQLQERGFGVPDLKEFDLDAGLGRISVKNSYNTHGYEEVGRPVCCTLSGILAGGAKGIFEEEWECEEVECAAEGSESCEFELKRVE